MVLFSRALLCSPELDELPGRCAAALRSASDELAGLTLLSPDTVRSAPAEHFAALSHRLSPAFEQLNAPPEGSRSTGECEALAIAGGPSGIDLTDPDGFKASLERLNSLVTAGAGRWRTGWAGLMPDAAGHQIKFPDAGEVPGRLEAIRRIMAGETGAPAIFEATLVLCLLVNGHPFSDGNGRTARMLFNVMLRRGGMPADVYFPFYEIAARSRGGYVIALRHAELRGDWQPIMDWVVAALGCHRRLGAGR